MLKKTSVNETWTFSDIYYWPQWGGTTSSAILLSNSSWQLSYKMYNMWPWCHISVGSDHARYKICDHGVIFKMEVIMSYVKSGTVVSYFRWQWSYQTYNVWPWCHITDGSYYIRCTMCVCGVMFQMTVVMSDVQSVTLESYISLP